MAATTEVAPAFFRDKKTTSSALLKSARRLSEGFTKTATNSNAALTPEDFSDEADDFASNLTAENGSSVSGPDTILKASFHWHGATLSLLIARRGGLHLWDCSELPTLKASAVIPATVWNGAEVTDAHLLSTPRSDQATTSKAWSMAPLVAVATVKSGTTSLLNVFSLKHGSVIKQIQVEGRIAKIESNARYLILACQSPSSLHVLSLHSLSPLPISPLLDVASPVFDLSPSRFLAYATTQPQSAHIGSGVIAARHWDQSDANEAEAGRGRDVLGTSPQEVARVVASGVYSGVKALGELGYSYFSAQPHSGPSVDSLSRSAPAKAHPPLQPMATVSSAPGYVKVIDLAQEGRSVAHFKASPRSLSTLKFDPSGSLLASTSTDGQSCHVFEIRPASRLTKVWHRYALNRGLTPARVVALRWAQDSTSLSICTASGTNHIFALQMNGGPRSAGVHFKGGSINPETPEALSVPVKPLTRLRPPTADSMPFLSDSSNRAAAMAASTLIWLPLKHSHVVLALDRQSRRQATSGYKHALVFYPHLDSMILFQLGVQPAPPSSPLLQPISGLTALLQSKGGRSPAGCTLDSLVHADAFAAWKVCATPAASGTIFTPLSAQKTVGLKPSQRKWLAEAELQTLSSSRRLVPRSPYLSHQLHYFHYARDTDFINGHFTPSIAAASVRKEVESSRMANDESLRSAMQSVLDLRATDAASHQRAPAFGNGLGGKQASWKNSLPVRSVAIGSTLQQVRHMSRRLSRTGRSLEDKTSLSFEEEHDTLILANNSSEDDVPSLDHTSGTSWSDPASQDLREDSWTHWNANGSLDFSPLPSPLSPTPVVAEGQLVEPFALDEDIVSTELPASKPAFPSPPILTVPEGRLISISPESDGVSLSSSPARTKKKHRKSPHPR